MRVECAPPGERLLEAHGDRHDQPPEQIDLLQRGIGIVSHQSIEPSMLTTVTAAASANFPVSARPRAHAPAAPARAILGGNRLRDPEARACDRLLESLRRRGAGCSPR